MEVKRIQAAMEAVLFASGEPMDLHRLSEAMELDLETTARLADDLANTINRADGGLQLVKLDDSYQLCSRQEFAPYVRRALDIRRNTPLSQAALEVLAIISYNQPVTRAFIDQVRGVDCGAVVQGLVAKALIEEKGRLDLPGRPLVYGTTPVFLRCFGLRSLNDLPPLPKNEDQTETTLNEVVLEQEGDAGSGEAS